MAFTTPWSTAKPTPAAGPPTEPGRVKLLGRIPPPLRLFLFVLFILFLWYGVIGTLRAGIEVDLALRPSATQLPPGGSVTVGMAARLLEDQVEDRAFTPNDPAFYPTGLARRTPAFQAALVKTTAAAVDALAAATPSPDLAAAAASLSVSPTLWWLRAGWPPVGLPAERHFARAIASLEAHNAALAARTPAAAPARRGLDPAGRLALAALMEAVEAEAARGDAVIRGTADTPAARQLAEARGTAFAAALLMRAIRDDNAAAIRLSGKAARWGEAIDALDAAAGLDPMFVRQDDLVRAGYSLLLAGNAMRSILGEQG
jgi:hypothetical protein